MRPLPRSDVGLVLRQETGTVVRDEDYGIQNVLHLPYDEGPETVAAAGGQRGCISTYFSWNCSLHVPSKLES